MIDQGTLNILKFVFMVTAILTALLTYVAWGFLDARLNAGTIRRVVRWCVPGAVAGFGVLVVADNIGFGDSVGVVGMVILIAALTTLFVSILVRRLTIWDDRKVSES